MTVAETTETEQALSVVQDRKALFKMGWEKLIKIENELKAELYERDELIHLSLLALITGGHLVAIGEPGTAKSMTIELICQRIVNEATHEGLKLFNVLLSADTKAEELYGPYDLKQLAEGIYFRKTDWYLPWAEIAFLDEIFNAPGYLLKTTLKIMNEKVYKNGDSPIWKKVPLNSVFGATNQLPVEDSAGDLAAMFDRFDFRLFIDPLTDSAFDTAFDERSDTPDQRSSRGEIDEPTVMSIHELRAIQDYVDNVIMPTHMRQAVKNLKLDLKNQEIRPTDRRWLKQVPRILKAEAIMNRRVKVDDDDLKVLENVLWSKADELPKIKKSINKFGNPSLVKAQEIMQEAQTVSNAFAAAINTPNITDDDKVKLAWESSRKFMEHLRQLKTIIATMKKEGRAVEKITAFQLKVIEMKGKVDDFQIGTGLV